MMLRHIVSIGLAMTACVTFMPTKASAATLTVTPVGEIPISPGELIDFTFVLNPTPSTTVEITDFKLTVDTAELSLIGERPPVKNRETSDTTLLTYVSMFKVRTPEKKLNSDVLLGNSDVSLRVNYNEFNQAGEPITIGAYTTAFGADIVPVPEPLTIFGTAIGLGCGVLFKRKSFKKTLS